MNSILSINSLAKSQQQKAPLTYIPSSLNYTLPVTAGVRLWLDADDPLNNRTKPSANVGLDTWKDKSGFGNDGSAFTGSTATTISWETNSFNNLPCFVLKGYTEKKYFGAQFINSSSITTNYCYVFIVACNSSSGSGTGTTSEFAARFIGLSNSSTADDFNTQYGFGYLRQQGTGLAPYRNNSYPISTNNPPSYNFNTVWHGGFLGSTAYASFLNGDSTVLRTATTSSLAFGITYYKVGSNTNINDVQSFLSGKICEILVYNTNLTTTQIYQIEGYLAWKWGLNSLLRSNHPYKNSAP